MRSLPTQAALLALAWLPAACRPSSSSTPSPTAASGAARAAFPDAWSFASGRRGPVGSRWMVASNHELASSAGDEILARGGNAVDAAVAVGFALAVVYPEAGNIGGGGYMVIRMADGRTASLDYREMAPLASTRDMFVGPDGRLTGRSVTGHLASGVPGAVAGMAEALGRHGTMRLADVMAPAIRLAREGFRVDTALERSVRGDSALIAAYEGAAVFLPGGRVPRVGETIRQPDLARTLTLIAERGPDAFYRGEIADSIVAEMRRGGGIITREDLAGYAPVWRDPLRTEYRGHTLIGMAPSSSGGIAVFETLNILEALGPMPPFGSAQRVHRLAEALRRSFADRGTRVGDPAFVQVPTEHLISQRYADSLARGISAARATPTGDVGEAPREGTHTTHYSVVDPAGNAVATTTTINSLYGSGAYVRGAGFFLNNEMDDFTARPGVANVFGGFTGAANAIEPRKRPLSAMSPTIVVDPQGRTLLVMGSRGGPRIITSMVQTLVNVIDHGMSLGDAVSAPRIHHQAWPDTLRYERGGFPATVIDSLARMGHAVAVATYQPGGFVARIHAVMRVPGGWEGFVDPRTSGGAVGR